MSNIVREQFDIIRDEYNNLVGVLCDPDGKVVSFDTYPGDEQVVQLAIDRLHEAIDSLQVEIYKTNKMEATEL